MGRDHHGQHDVEMGLCGLLSGQNSFSFVTVLKAALRGPQGKARTYGTAMLRGIQAGNVAGAAYLMQARYACCMHACRWYSSPAERRKRHAIVSFPGSARALVALARSGNMQPTCARSLTYMAVTCQRTDAVAALLVELTGRSASADVAAECLESMAGAGHGAAVCRILQHAIADGHSSSVACLLVQLAQ